MKRINGDTCTKIFIFMKQQLSSARDKNIFGNQKQKRFVMGDIEIIVEVIISKRVIEKNKEF